MIRRGTRTHGLFKVRDEAPACLPVQGLRQQPPRTARLSRAVPDGWAAKDAPGARNLGAGTLYRVGPVPAPRPARVANRVFHRNCGKGE